MKHKDREKHNLSKHPLYRTWVRMKTRCLNPNYDRYPQYGGRGITICEEWKNSFLSFYNWAINNGYSAGLTIDRIDNNGNYEPSNCRWRTNKQQANNRRTNHLITHNGETHTITEWAEITGVHKNTIRTRLEKGLSTDEIFKQPVKRCG